ncbi:MAG: porin family protein [Calothrix sp. SM1_5_4]|nr:porin family protein [Calothrix sp. SM1_5_4]
MIKMLLLRVFSVIVATVPAAALAQEYNFTVGVHQTTADSGVAGASTDGKFNFKAGLGMAFELADGMHFRTGAIYNQRHFDEKTSFKREVNFDYIDVPANFQYGFNDMFALFGGLIVGINVNDDTDVPRGITVTDPEAKGLVPLINLGANFLFNDMVGFDLYYERGLGDFAEELKDYSSFGGNFLYWF